MEQWDVVKRGICGRLENVWVGIEDGPFLSIMSFVSFIDLFRVVSSGDVSVFVELSVARYTIT